MDQIDTAGFEEWEKDYLSQTDALSTAPSATEAWLIRGHILNDHGYTDEAIACYRNAIASDPICEAAYESIVSTLESAGRLAEAIDTAIEAIRARVGLLNAVTLDKYAQPDKDRLLKAFEDHHSKRTPDEDS